MHLICRVRLSLSETFLDPDKPKGMEDICLMTRHLRSILLVFVAICTCSGMVLAQEGFIDRRERRELHLDRREIRSDRRELRLDHRELYRDRLDRRRDVRELR